MIGIFIGFATRETVSYQVLCVKHDHIPVWALLYQCGPTSSEKKAVVSDVPPVLELANEFIDENRVSEECLPWAGTSLRTISPPAWTR